MEESQVFTTETPADQTGIQVESKVASTTIATPETKPALVVPTEAQDWIGEGKKYQSVEAALKAVPHAQSHIKTLEQELAQAREELAKRKAAEDLLNEIKQASIPQQVTPHSVEADPEVLSQIVEQVLEKKTAQQTAQQNAKTVIEKLTAAFGDKAKEQYYALAAANGMSVQTLDALSMQSPSAVLKLAGIDSKQSTISKLQSDVNTAGLTNNQTPASSRVPDNATSRQMADAFKVAKEAILKQYNQ